MGGPVTQLPKNFKDLAWRKTLLTVVMKRKSSRVYTQESLSLLQLSFLLWVTQGVKEIRGKSYATLRTVPCGGARHPFETYLLVRKVEGLGPRGLPLPAHDPQLELLAPMEDEEALRALIGEKPVRPAVGGQVQRGVLLVLRALSQRVALRHLRPPDGAGGRGPRGGEPVPGLRRPGPGHLRHRRL